MQESLNDYLDRAKAATNTKSDRNLSLKIGLSHGAVSEWRRGKNLPTDEVMIRLAQRAKLDPTESLILLNLWRATGEAKATYAAMLKKFTATAGGIILAFSLSWGINNNALKLKGNLESAHVQGTYNGADIAARNNDYATLRKRINRLYSRLINGFKRMFYTRAAGI